MNIRLDRTVRNRFRLVLADINGRRTFERLLDAINVGRNSGHKYYVFNMWGLCVASG